MAKPKRLEGGKGGGKGKPKGKARGSRGPAKGAKDVGLSSSSRPKFKRNSGKFKPKARGKPVVKGKEKDKRTQPSVEPGSDGEAVVRTGAKRKREEQQGEGKQERDKRFRVLVKKAKEKQPLTRKERRELKKKKRKNYDLISQTLQLWEKLRRHDLKAAERSDLLDQMMSLITGHVYEFALKHDTARIVQCCLKFGTPQHHTTIFTELKDHVVELSKSKYAKFAVKAMMRLSTPEQRHQLISGLYGNVHRLARHKEAADVLETAYNDYANASERANLVQEFYGRKFALFKSKEGEEKGLGEILEGGETGERESVLEHMREALAKLLDKSVVRHSIVHRALLDFLTHCDHTSRSDMIDQLKELLVEMLHTKDGSRVTLLCLWHGTPKVRKAIVKSFKPYVRKICVEESGHVVMMGVFDTVDDTVLVRKHILSEMALDLGELCESPVGRRVVLYLLSPRNRRHFSSQFLQNVLEPGDGNKHTKKPREVRNRELLEGVAEPLLSLARERASDWARSKPHSPLLLQIAASLPGAVAHIGAPLVELLAADFDPSDHFVVHPCGHWVVKRLLNCEEIGGGGGEGGDGEGGEERENEDEKRGGSREKETGGDEIEETKSFAEMVLEGVSEDNIRAWTNTNRGAFIVCSLLSSKVKGVRENTKNILEPALKTIRTGTLEGQKALWKDLNSNNKTNH